MDNQPPPNDRSNTDALRPTATDAPPHWQLPPGVSRGLWDYAHSEAVATDYDNYFIENQLFEFDEQVLARYLVPPGLVADLGCGTARALMPLTRRGYRGLAIDISDHMLEVVREKATQENLPIECLNANLVQLDPVDDDSVDHAMCMFSTLGMIRGQEHRQQALTHVRRILRPGGRFVLHVHNFWFNLFDPGGPWWVFRSLFRSRWQRDFERGDKFFDYRGVPKMFLHVFTRGELRRDLRRAGFRIVRWIPLHHTRQRELRHAWWCGRLRANGWIIVCE